MDGAIKIFQGSIRPTTILNGSKNWNW